MGAGASWASTALIKGKEDQYIVSSILSWLSELGHSKVTIQSDGEPASEVVMRTVQSKGAMLENPPGEIIQQQSQRYSHQSDGGAERMARTTRDHIKAYKIQFDKNSGIIVNVDSRARVVSACSASIQADITGCALRAWLAMLASSRARKA